jgi:hypothetical protein
MNPNVMVGLAYVFKIIAHWMIEGKLQDTILGKKNQATVFLIGRN